MGRSYTGNRCLLVIRVNGSSRLPVPPARITPFTSLLVAVASSGFAPPVGKAAGHRLVRLALESGAVRFGRDACIPEEDSVSCPRRYFAHCASARTRGP